MQRKWILVSVSEVANDTGRGRSLRIELGGERFRSKWILSWRKIERDYDRWLRNSQVLKVRRHSDWELFLLNRVLILLLTSHSRKSEKTCFALLVPGKKWKIKSVHILLTFAIYHAKKSNMCRDMKQFFYSLQCQDKSKTLFCSTAKLYIFLITFCLFVCFFGCICCCCFCCSCCSGRKRHSKIISAYCLKVYHCFHSIPLSANLITGGRFKKPFQCETLSRRGEKIMRIPQKLKKFRSKDF